MSISVVGDSTWSRVGEVAPTALIDARVELHYAAQIAVSAAISYIPAQADDSHTALTWSAEHRALVTEPITAAGPFRIGLRVEDLTLLVLDEKIGATGSFALPGRTSADAHIWLSEIMAEVGLDSGCLTSRKHYTIPDRRVGTDAPFSDGIARELRELARYWSSAAALLNDLVRAAPGASAVRTWPHHFDIAMLIALPGTPRRTIGVGQSPGDDSYGEPYWYVGLYPYPDARVLPPLAAGGHWHTTGWLGAALPASAFIGATDQRAQVTAFVESAVTACRRLLGD